MLMRRWSLALKICFLFSKFFFHLWETFLASRAISHSKTRLSLEEPVVERSRDSFSPTETKRRISALVGPSLANVAKTFLKILVKRTKTVSLSDVGWPLGGDTFQIFIIGGSDPFQTEDITFLANDVQSHTCKHPRRRC